MTTVKKIHSFEYILETDVFMFLKIHGIKQDLSCTTERMVLLSIQQSQQLLYLMVSRSAREWVSARYNFKYF